MLKTLKKFFGTANDRIINKLKNEVLEINKLEAQFASLSDQALRAKTQEYRTLLADGKSLEDLTYPAFATVREVAKRVLKTRHYDVQLIGGLILHRGMITEMRTGEGKTLVATLPAYLNTLTGKGVHIVTVNDYLAKRDAQWMGKIYEFLGLKVACIISGMDDDERKAAYNADITYATNNELGFDYLRDNMKFTVEARVQRSFNFAIIDEVDSILIDEARTPLIISGPVDDNSKLYYIIDRIVDLLEADCYEIDEKAKTINLTENGNIKIEQLLVNNSLIAQNTSLYDFENMKLIHFVNQALKAHHLFNKDVDYIVKDKKLMLIDEFTGRIMEGRRYSEGLHQALEAKEKLKVQNENQTLASITFQNYFKLYKKISGMTGTAMTEAAELKDIYGLDVISIPTHNPVRRIDHEDEIYGTKQEKYQAIAQLVKECNARGQPVLIGTVSIEKSEEISNLLEQHQILHNVLNAKHHEQEAYIIAQAGRYKAVTIATNMAGRGTDIKLGGNLEMISETLPHDLSVTEYEIKIQEINNSITLEKEQVVQAGGLYIIGTERHESRRIDNQLRGRAGRQGDPGATKFYLSLEDDLMRIFASDRISGLLRGLGLKGGEAIHHPMISRALEKAQQKVEAHHYEIRKNLLKFDNVMNDQRKVIYEQRNDIIIAQELANTLTELANQIIERVVITHIPPESFREKWNLEGLKFDIEHFFGLEIDLSIIAKQDVLETDIIDKIKDLIRNNNKRKKELYGEKVFNQALKYIFLTTLDQVWKDHLHTLDHLRQGITLRAYGQKDPLNEYKKEAFNIFNQLLDHFSEQVVSSASQFQLDLSHIDQAQLALSQKSAQTMYETREDPAFAKYNAGSSIETSLKPTKSYIPTEKRDPGDPNSWGRVSRNESCPCLSGKKYKHCHGMNN